MTSKSDNQSELSEHEKLLGKNNDLSSNQESILIPGQETCERLTLARKSLTRCKSIEESIEIATENDAENPSDAVNGRLSPDTKMESVEDSKEKEDSKSPVDDNSIGENGVEQPTKEGDCDNISASLSVIRMDKFALEKRRVSRILPRCLHRTFVDPDVEQLFQVYHKRQRRVDLLYLLYSGILFVTYAILFSNSILTWIILIVLGTLQIVMIILYEFVTFPEIAWAFLPYIAWSLSELEILVFIILGPTMTSPIHALLWIILLTFLIFVTLPLRLPSCLSLAVFTYTSLITASVMKSQVVHVSQVS